MQNNKTKMPSTQKLKRIKLHELIKQRRTKVQNVKN